MSILIQKKRFNKKTSDSVSGDSSLYERQDLLYQQYLKNFDNFEATFTKSVSLKNMKGIKQSLNTFYKTIKNDELLISDLSKQKDPLPKNSKDFCLLQKATKIINLLADYFVNKRVSVLQNKKAIDFLEKSSIECREITILVIKLLKIFAMINSTFATILSHWPSLTETLLQLVLHDNKLYFKQVVGVLEALISSNPNAISLEMYPAILEILSTMPKKNFARFSRILALFVLENSEKTDFGDLPTGYTENKMIRIHSFLLSIPNLLENYVSILEYLREIIQCLTLITPESLQKTITYLKDSKIIRNSGLNLSFLKPLFEQCQISESLMTEVFSFKFVVKFVVKKSNITEIFFILSNLLSSKRKLDIQDQLSQLNFFNRVIDPLFDILFHPSLDLEGSEDSTPGSENYSSNPLTTTRIQLLRIIINFCDRDSPNIHHKELLISNEEKQLLYSKVIKPIVQYNTANSESIPSNQEKLLSAFENLPLGPENKSNNFFTTEILTTDIFKDVQKKGLLNKIISFLMRVHGNSSYYFWLSSCVESLLRGFYCIHQIFVAHTGLLYNLLDHIMNDEIQKANNIQISYDLVGEILKYNKHNILFLENLCRRFGWTQPLIKKFKESVVDSNVVLRSILLSAEKFHIEEVQEEGEENVCMSKSLSLLNSIKNNDLEFSRLLVEAIDPDTINQDNICCINTVLIMAIFAEYKGELPILLSNLINQYGMNTSPHLKSLTNLDKSLDIWNKYYLAKTKDSFSLQYTTSIRFEYFIRIKQKIQNFLKENLQNLEIE